VVAELEDASLTLLFPKPAVGHDPEPIPTKIVFSFPVYPYPSHMPSPL